MEFKRDIAEQHVVMIVVPDKQMLHISHCACYSRLGKDKNQRGAKYRTGSICQTP